MTSRTLPLSLLLLIAAPLWVGCTAAVEEVDESDQHLETPVYGGSYVELVDTTPDRPSNEPHGFAYRAKNDSGDSTTLHPGESVVLKVSAKTLAAMRWNNPRPIDYLQLSIDYWRGDYENKKHDERRGDTSTEDFFGKGWTSSAFTIPRGIDHMKLWLSADGYPLGAPWAVIELGETLPPPNTEE